jgi:hypothetical protein
VTTTSPRPRFKRTGIVSCDDGITCTVDACDPVDGCSHTPDDSLCPAKPGCDAVCDPDNPDRDENGCVYVCECPDNTSPKQCPPQSGEEFSCKVAASGAGCDVNDPDESLRPKGSVQVACGPDGDEPFCFCQSTRCVVGGEEFTRGEVVNVCSPAPCAWNISRFPRGNIDVGEGCGPPSVFHSCGLTETDQSSG